MQLHVYHPATCFIAVPVVAKSTASPGTCLSHTPWSMSHGSSALSHTWWVGFAVGGSVGTFVGIFVVGAFVGCFVVGDPVGKFVGIFVAGASVGFFVVGEPVGEWVGNLVVGAFVGTFVGAAVTLTHAWHLGSIVAHM